MKIFAGNWKLQKSPRETRQFFSEFLGMYSAGANKKVVFFPSSPSLEACAESLKHSKIEWGSQNCYSEGKGAFTGETSASVVKELGGHWILLGHSERRTLFAETNEVIAGKVNFVQSLGLTPMLCIGETLQERESGKTNQVIQQQLEKSLLVADRNKPVAIAYEPVWAIGTGKVASLQQVAEAHQEVHRQLGILGFPKSTPVLYGGSVKSDNAKELIQVPGVDGFLVGGASLEPKSFWDICQSI